MFFLLAVGSKENNCRFCGGGDGGWGTGFQQTDLHQHLERAQLQDLVLGHANGQRAAVWEFSTISGQLIDELLLRVLGGLARGLEDGDVVRGDAGRVGADLNEERQS